jgi:hypothetical protein
MKRMLVTAMLLSACTPTPEAIDNGAASNLAGDGDGNALRPTLTPMTNDSHSPVLATPEVVFVVWPGDEMIGAQAREIVDAAMRTPSYWGVLAQYGIGAGSTKDVVVLPTAAPTTLDDEKDLQPLIDQLIAAGSLPQPTPSTLYMFLPPTTTTLTLYGAVSCGGGTLSCGSFGGYHYETASSNLVYGVVPRCSGPTLTDDVTIALTHELAEAVTDPHPNTAPAWTQAGGQEIADLCATETATLTLASGQAAAATTLWSNAAAQQRSGDPCQPSTKKYFNVAFPLQMALMLDADGNGETTIELSPFADPGITGLNYSISGWGGGCDPHAMTTIMIGKDGTSYSSNYADSATPGQKQTLRVRVGAAAPSDASYVITVYAQNGADTQVWNGTVALARPAGWTPPGTGSASPDGGSP